MKELTLAELAKWKAEERDFELVDVREAEEHEQYNIGGKLIPLGELFQQTEIIDHSKPVVFYCKRGIRSQIAVQKLERKMGWDNLYNLRGGCF